MTEREAQGDRVCGLRIIRIQHWREGIGGIGWDSSGVGATQPHDVLWYSRTFEIGEGDSGRTVLIHFGAVDYDCTVWVNGIYVGGHAGGGTHFAADAGFCVHAGTNLLVVRAADGYSWE